ncbi:MAG: hypothetical protein AB7P21_05180 [Lautropia sp.]
MQPPDDDTTTTDGLGAASTASVLDAMEAVGLADQLLIARTDLERLDALVDDAARGLLGAFFRAERCLANLPADAPPQALEAREAVSSALTVMQFPDMARQILTHVVARLEAVTDRLGALAGDEPTVALVERACPVAQREMDAGSVELF